MSRGQWGGGEQRIHHTAMLQPHHTCCCGSLRQRHHCSPHPPPLQINFAGCDVNYIRVMYSHLAEMAAWRWALLLVGASTGGAGMYKATHETAMVGLTQASPLMSSLLPLCALDGNIHTDQVYTGSPKLTTVEHAMFVPLELSAPW